MDCPYTTAMDVLLKCTNKKRGTFIAKNLPFAYYNAQQHFGRRYPVYRRFHLTLQTMAEYKRPEKSWCGWAYAYCDSDRFTATEKATCQALGEATQELIKDAGCQENDCIECMTRVYDSKEKKEGAKRVLKMYPGLTFSNIFGNPFIREDFRHVGMLSDSPLPSA